jgi:hypothetical protein
MNFAARLRRAYSIPPSLVCQPGGKGDGAADFFALVAADCQVLIFVYAFDLVALTMR